MFHDSGAHVVKKPMGFLAVSALGFSAVLVTALVSVTGLAVYGIRVVDKKTGNLMELVQETAKTLPEIRAALPPALADALDDVRVPEYRDSLLVSTKLSEGTDRWGYHKATVEVENTGDQTVSLLSMRLVGLDGDGDPSAEYNVWAATPLQIEDEWRGPLLPRETRRFVIRGFPEKSVTQVVPEITEVRLWNAAKTEGAESKS
ncbi:MAG: hypothetical protein DCC65_17255 [Planctomycetota bacterium]|nr:MAG: hypothetical protein DCC65_17255 [Planctomycetota bacterium]